jgi:hypothetical protein
MAGNHYDTARIVTEALRGTFPQTAFALSCPRMCGGPLEQRDRLTIEECRQLLGAECEGWTDTKVERLRDRLEVLARELYPVIGQRAAEDLEGLKWIAYVHRHGLNKEDLIVDDDDDEDIAEDDRCPVQ